MQFLTKLFIFLFGVSEDANPDDISNEISRIWGEFEDSRGLFTSNITNSLFPLMPGHILNYKGKVEEGVPATSSFDTTPNTKDIMGVECREVHEKFYIDGVLKEEMTHWFAQDVLFETVWYFGRDYKLFDKKGNVKSTEGSWMAGEQFSFPGVMMKGNAKVDDHYHHEYAKGVAEDEAKVLSLSESVKVPYGSYDDCLMTLEYSHLNPGINMNNYYAKGVGLLRSHKISGGMKYVDLVSISHYKTAEPKTTD